MGILKKLFKLAQSEAHDAVDKMGDKVKLAKQTIRDKKEEYNKAVEVLSQAEAAAIKEEADFQRVKNEIDSYNQKLSKLKEKYDAGDKSVESAIKAALMKVSQMKKNLEKEEQEAKEARAKADAFTEKVESLRKKIELAENQIKDYENRIKFADSQAKINKSMSGFSEDDDSLDTVINGLEETALKKEALAEAYDNIGKHDQSADDIINAALGKDSNSEEDDLFNEFMNKK